MTITMVMLLALLNGCCISFCRILNGRLGQDSSAFNASLWNHVVGFVFLSLIVYLVPSTPLGTIMEAPITAWLGGVIGAVFVAMNSYVLLKVGATLTTLLVIGGQLLTGAVLDAVSHGIALMPLVGVLLILAGVLVTKITPLKGVIAIKVTR